MPEGDTIFRHAEQLSARLVGKRVTALWARGVSYASLAGETVGAVSAHGKHLLIDVGTRARLHVHLGMNGRLRLEAPAALSPFRAARASLALVTAEVAAIWSFARTVEVLRLAFAHAHPVLRALGPDLLAADFDAGAAVARARGRPGATAIGELLLDQQVAAGIGNVYKSEALFVERLDPWTPVERLDDAQLARVYLRARALMQRNLGSGRRTTTGGARGPLSGAGGGAMAARALGSSRYHVYRRAPRPCALCATPIRAAAQGSPPRMTYYCPRCQRAGVAAPPES